MDGGDGHQAMSNMPNGGVQTEYRGSEHAAQRMPQDDVPKLQYTLLFQVPRDIDAGVFLRVQHRFAWFRQSSHWETHVALSRRKAWGWPCWERPWVRLINNGQ